MTTEITILSELFVRLKQLIILLEDSKDNPERHAEFHRELGDVIGWIQYTLIQCN
jgi:hypothetical protein